MVWKIEYLKSVSKDLKKVDKQTINRIKNFLENRLVNLDNPRSIGEALKGSILGNLWKYRVGDYRIVASIQDTKLTILIVHAGNRKDIYNR